MNRENKPMNITEHENKTKMNKEKQKHDMQGNKGHTPHETKAPDDNKDEVTRGSTSHQEVRRGHGSTGKVKPREADWGKAGQGKAG